jgi:hypothetical protein
MFHNIGPGVSSPPGRPIIELSSRISVPEEDSVTDEINLTWGVPEDDGGYPITGGATLERKKLDQMVDSL